MYVLYKSKNILTLVTIGFIVGMYIEYCYGPKWPYWIYIAYIGLFGTSICRYRIWVELPVQRRLCPIFVKNVGSPDIHEHSAGLQVVNGPPGFGASQLNFWCSLFVIIFYFSCHYFVSMFCRVFSLRVLFI